MCAASWSWSEGSAAVGQDHLLMCWSGLSHDEADRRAPTGSVGPLLVFQEVLVWRRLRTVSAFMTTAWLNRSTRSPARHTGWPACPSCGRLGARAACCASSSSRMPARFSLSWQGARSFTPAGPGHPTACTMARCTRQSRWDRSSCCQLPARWRIPGQGVDSSWRPRRQEQPMPADVRVLDAADLTAGGSFMAFGMFSARAPPLWSPSWRRTDAMSSGTAGPHLGR